MPPMQARINAFHLAACTAAAYFVFPLCRPGA